MHRWGRRRRRGAAQPGGRGRCIRGLLLAAESVEQSQEISLCQRRAGRIRPLSHPGALSVCDVTTSNRGRGSVRLESPRGETGVPAVMLASGCRGDSAKHLRVDARQAENDPPPRPPRGAACTSQPARNEQAMSSVPEVDVQLTVRRGAVIERWALSLYKAVPRSGLLRSAARNRAWRPSGALIPRRQAAGRHAVLELPSQSSAL